MPRGTKYTKEEIQKNREKFFGPNKSVIELNKKRNQKRGVAFKGDNDSSSKTKSKVTSKGNFVTYKGKRYLKTSPMGKRAIAIQKRDKLASKNYMSKAMIEKRKKRLKIKK